MIPIFLAAAALTINPRLQWDENDGYCGEVCFITAGLNCGQYMSQYDARAIAIQNQPQTQGELLLGQNDTYAANQMHFQTDEWTGKEQGTFFDWVEGHVAKGDIVAIGLYMNQYIFYGDTDKDAGDPDYDHMGVVTAVNGNKISFSDNGLYSDTGEQPPYFFDAIPATREEANDPNGNTYSLTENQYYGIALMGTTDKTLPVTVTTNVNYESPEITDRSDKRPNSMPITLTITVSGLEAGKSYTLSCYNSFSESSPTQTWSIQASGSTYTMQEDIQSDQICIYRCTQNAKIEDKRTLLRAARDKRRR